jgi:hypothetical protein
VSDDVAFARSVVAFAAVVDVIVFVSVPEVTGFSVFTSENCRRRDGAARCGNG